MIDWENQQLQQRQLQQQLQQDGLHLQHAQQQQQQIRSGSVNGNEGAGGAIYVKVMTDEQLETLRKQIAVYRTICEQLVEAHKNLTAQQDLAGARLGSLYCDPFIISTGHKISSRQRWTPTPMQLQILESIFDQGNGTPSKQKIKDMTAELSQHGQISETNVYNWFQNRRARSKRKHQNSVSNNNPTESEAEAEVESAKDKMNRAQNPHSLSQHSSVPRLDEMSFQNPEICSDMNYLDPQNTKADSMILSDGFLKSTSLGPIPIFDGNEMLLNSRNDYMTDKSFSQLHLYQQGGESDYLMTE